MQNGLFNIKMVNFLLHIQLINIFHLKYHHFWLEKFKIEWMNKYMKPFTLFFLI